ncbi:MAG: DUF3306 domain-containing protein [Gammaproteobacteria bacterium]
MSKERKPGVVDTTATDENFLARWSRRKAEARDGPASAADPVDQAECSDAEPADAGESDTQPVQSEEAGQSSEYVPGDEDMPSIEDLTDDDDYSAFFSPGVSPGLRKKALARLFRSPKFNIRDGLDDYDDDYTTFKPLGSTITAEMRHRAEDLLRRQAEAAKQALEDPSTSEPVEGTTVAAGSEHQDNNDSFEEADGAGESELGDERKNDT